ncbi:MAG: hypothetical protein JXA78_01660 [Anaerolineales bacterium]|nr:hypothetical protein [Anaerolineales bacterium]
MKITWNRSSISTSMAPEVIFEAVHGELQARGWDRPEVVISANTDDLKAEEQDDVVRINCQGNCTVHLPYSATLRVENAHADASFKFLKDQLDIGQVHGSLDLRDVAGVQIERVHGQLSVRGLTGDLHASKVDGNASLRGIQGGCILEQVQGNLDLRDVEGEVQADVDGNALLRLSAMSGADCQVHADGNLHCQIPADASLRLILASEAETIQVRLPDGSQTYNQAECELLMGDGAATLKLSAAGSLYLSSQKADWRPSGDQEAEIEGLSEEFNQQIAQQIETQIQAQMAQMTRQLNEQMAHLSEKINRAGLSPLEAERIVGQALEASERETSRAQEKLRRAQEKLERKLEASRRRGPVVDRRTRAYGRGDWDFPATAPQPPSPQASEEERLMILRMLEQKKITPDEAEQLLSALEGRD